MSFPVFSSECGECLAALAKTDFCTPSGTLRSAALPLKGRAVKFFPEQRQFRFRVFRARDSVPFLSAALREAEYSLAETQRFLILKLPELSAGDCPEHGINPAKA